MKIEYPKCYGKFLKVNGEDCDNCKVLKQCYEIFKENEKKLEEYLKTPIPWYKRCDILEGVCEKCG